jgi:hypothetical protein
MPARLTVTLYRGTWGTVECAVRGSGEVPAQTFLQGRCREIREKGRDDLLATAEARFMNLFYQMANVGPMRMPAKRFQSRGGGVYYFRHEIRNSPIRFPCFLDSACCILTHGFVKPGAKKKRGGWPPGEIKRAKDIMTEYFRRKATTDGAGQGRKS